MYKKIDHLVLASLSSCIKLRFLDNVCRLANEVDN